MNQDVYKVEFGIYDVYSNGTVFNRNSDKWIKFSLSGRHYVAELTNPEDGIKKFFKLHLLIARLFVPNPYGVESLHEKTFFKDGNYNNVVAENICWHPPRCEVNGMKVCSKCRIEYPATNEYFIIDNSRQSGFKHICKKCTKHYPKVKYSKHKEPIKIDPDGFRRCRQCNTLYPATSDYFNKSKGNKIGLMSKCNKCRKKYRDTHLVERRLHEMNRRNSDPFYRLLINTRTRIGEAIRRVISGKKYYKTQEVLGIDENGFISHIEGLFLDGMTWGNYGKGLDKWCVDHDRPCASFDLTDPEQQKECFHYSNLRPIWWLDNIKKGSNYDGKKHYCNKS